jgi:hypothetical protein
MPFFSLKVPIILCVLPFEFRPGEPSGFDLLSSPDDVTLVISSRRYAPGYLPVGRQVHIRRFQRHEKFAIPT